MSVSTCKRCRVKKANRRGTLCNGCFRAAGGEQRAKTGAKVSEQLRAVRRAAKLKAGVVADDPEVDVYVRLKEQDVKAFVALRERLEREHAAVRGAVVPVGAPSPGPVESDGYDPGADTVTPKLEAMIERWLAGVKERAEEGLP